jgi:DNA repair protein RadC
MLRFYEVVMQETQDIQQLYMVPQIELSYHSKIKPCDRKLVNKSETAYRIFLEAWDKNKIELIEQCKLLLLDRACRCIGIVDISKGGVNETIIDPKIVFAAALKSRSSNIILAHNHPSGNLEPSSADIKLTKFIKSGGEILSTKLTDHLIISPWGYISMADECLMP